MSKFITKFNKKSFPGESLDTTPHELYDGLRPYSVAEQVRRFTIAGEQLIATRRRELASFRGEVDDPDDVRTDLDKEHITPADVASAQLSHMAHAKQRKEEQEAAQDKLANTEPQATTSTEAPSAGTAPKVDV